MDRKGRGHRRHPPTHTAPEGSLTSTREAKNINQFCPPPVLRKLNSCLINTDGGQNQRSSLGGQFFFSPTVCLAQTFGHKRRFFSLCLKICSGVYPPMQDNNKKKKRGEKKPEKKHYSAGPCWLLGIKASYFSHFQPNLHCFPLQIFSYLLFLAAH